MASTWIQKHFLRFGMDHAPCTDTAAADENGTAAERVGGFAHPMCEKTSQKIDRITLQIMKELGIQ